MQRGDEATGFDKFCQYGTNTGKITILPPTILVQGELQDSSQSLQGTEARPTGCSDPALLVHLQAPSKVNIQTPDRCTVNNRCLQWGLWGSHEQPIFLGQMACKKGQKHPHQYPGTENSVGGLSKVQGIIEGKDCLLLDRQHNSINLSVEGQWHSLQYLKWSCEKDSPQVSWEWDNGVPWIPQRCSKSLSRCPIQGQEGSGVESRGPSMLQVIQVLGNPSSGPHCKQSDSQDTLIFQPGSLRQGASGAMLWRRGGQRASDMPICLPTSKQHPDGYGQDSKMRREPDHDHTLLSRSELVPRDHASVGRATKKVQTITVAPIECQTLGGNSKGHEKHPADCLEAHITICAQRSIR